MKKYILIQNDGEIETNSFELIGASTKRDVAGKIGFFGSGLKYSIAYMMRNSIEFKVFSGLNEIVFTTTPEILRDQTFHRICINNTPTSYTTTMGATWTEDWFVLREIYCNAIDEDSCIVVKDMGTPQPTEGKTRIFIEMTENLKKVIERWDFYFSDERVPLFESSDIYTCFLGSNDGKGTVTNQNVKVFSKTDGVVYRRGIKVGEIKQLMYDYEFTHVNINEDRTAKDLHAMGYVVSSMFTNFCNEGYIKSVLRSAGNDIYTREYSALTSFDKREKFNDAWVLFSKTNLLVVKEISGRYAEDIASSKKECFLLPAYFAKALKQELPEASVLGMGAVVGDGFFSEVGITPKMEYLLKEVSASLKEMNYVIPFDIKVVEFDDDKTLGRADLQNKNILLSKQLFDLGRREIALCLMEETEHIKSGKEDETRAFQNHIFSKWLTTMEESNSLFL